jgi:hypothetical protein
MATCTGVHDYDQLLPEWSPSALAEAAAEMRAIRNDLDVAGRREDDEVCRYPEDVDLALADGFLEIQIAEHEGRHFYPRNPALWSGEAIFGIVTLLTRSFAPIDRRLHSATARMLAMPRFLADARQTLTTSPAEWRARALRECDAAEMLFARSLPAWLPRSGASASMTSTVAAAATVARDTFRDLARWLRHELPTESDPPAAGRELLSLLLVRGHWCRTPIDALIREARATLDEAHDELSRAVAKAGASSWLDVEARLTDSRPTEDDYLPRFERTWRRFRQVALDHDLVTWPDAPIRYVPIPDHMRDAAPLLYYLSYRSPAPFDRTGTYDYVVPPLDGLAREEVGRRLRAAHDAAIALNHVVHHGGLGHHVQNWFACRSASRIGQVAAVDAASRIAMFSGGSLAEGWACYACDLMDEVGALTPLEQVSEQHTRVRLAARAVVDLSFHGGIMAFDEAMAFLSSRGLMAAHVARAEAVKMSMFPATAVMYWLGTRGIHDLRDRMRAREGPAFRLRTFHDRLLGYGAIPVALIARLMLGGPEHGCG